MNTTKGFSREEVMKKFDLVGHPEGGYFRQTYIKKSVAANGEGLEPSLPQATAIYFMITGDNFSSWHRVPHDEIFHFYQGESVEFLMITPEGKLNVRRFGADLQNGDEPQIVVPGGTWQAFRILNPDSNDSWSLMGTTMSPGFQFETFEIGSRDAMLREFPEHREIIEALTRE